MRVETDADVPPSRKRYHTHGLRTLQARKESGYAWVRERGFLTAHVRATFEESTLCRLRGDLIVLGDFDRTTSEDDPEPVCRACYRAMYRRRLRRLPLPAQCAIRVFELAHYTGKTEMDARIAHLALHRALAGVPVAAIHILEGAGYWDADVLAATPDDVLLLERGFGFAMLDALRARIPFDPEKRRAWMERRLRVPCPMCDGAGLVDPLTAETYELRPPVHVHRVMA